MFILQLNKKTIYEDQRFHDWPQLLESQIIGKILNSPVLKDQESATRVNPTGKISYWYEPVTLDY